MKSITLLVAAALLVPASATAHGENVAVVVYGAAKPQQRDVVVATVQNALRSAAWTVQDQPLSTREHEAVIACISLDRPWPCVAATARNKGVDHLVVIHIQADKADKDLILTGQILVAGNTVPSTDRSWCPKCTDATLATAASELAALMLNHSMARKSAMDNSASPSGDTTGNHRGSVGAAATTTPSSPPVLESQQSVSSRSRLVPALAIGTGVVAIGIGSYLSYRAAGPSDGPQPQYIFSGPGIGLAVAGGAAVGLGIYLWTRSSTHAETHASAPTLSPASGGAVAGWFANF